MIVAPRRKLGKIVYSPGMGYLALHRPTKTIYPRDTGSFGSLIEVVEFACRRDLNLSAWRFGVAPADTSPRERIRPLDVPMSRVVALWGGKREPATIIPEASPDAVEPEIPPAPLVPADLAARPEMAREINLDRDTVPDRGELASRPTELAVEPVQTQKRRKRRSEK